MAVVHRAELTPTKLELLAGWLPSRPWYQGPTDPDVRREAAYRFDDPADEVGIETLLVRAGDGPLLQVPLTYRDAPLDGGDEWLIGTTEHSVLGRRWVYDGCGDPVYTNALANAVFTGGRQADEFVNVDGRLEPREPSATVRGSGNIAAPTIAAVARVEDRDPTLIVTDNVEMTVLRVLEGEPPVVGDQPTLTGSWNGQGTLLLAYATPR